MGAALRCNEERLRDRVSFTNGATTMSLFSSIRDKIFGHKHNQAEQTSAAGSGGVPQQQKQQRQQPASATPVQNVDVGAVLSEMAATKGGGGNYKTSIVDLLKLLGLDSSLSARKALGEELGVNAGEDGSAEQNIALHKAVMDKLAANGGMVPDDMRH
jgi:hypothetical protein